MRHLFVLYLETPGDGGGGGGSFTGGSAPTNISGAGSASTSNTGVAEPSVIDLDNDALIRIKGQANPVKFGEHVKGFQAQWTKAAQEAARLKKDLAERDQRLAAFERQTPQQGSHASEDPLAALEALPYLTGKDAKAAIASIYDQFKQRDMVLLAALKQLQQTQQTVRGLHETHTSSAFDAKIGKWLTEGNYPAEAADLAKEIYLAYEGDDLDAEFPQIFATRWGQLEKAFDARRTQKINAARKQPFVPGKGGQTGPSKPFEIKGNAKSRDVAAQIWDAMGIDSNT